MIHWIRRFSEVRFLWNRMELPCGCCERLCSRLLRMASCLGIMVLALLLGPGQSVDARDLSAEYAAVVYDTSAGLNSLEMNAIVQTGDGYIWAGGYSGLYRYDGLKFEPVLTDYNISSVMSLLADVSGNLWIGTNDSGLAHYDVNSGKVTIYNVENGLDGNSVRDICEDEDHNIYAATTSGLSKVAADGTISTVNKTLESGFYRSVAYSTDGYLVCVNNSGYLFCFKDDKTKAVLSCVEDGIYYNRVGAGKGGEILVGTSGSRLEYYNPGKNLKSTKLAGNSGEQSGHDFICYDENLKGYWVGSDVGVGFFDKDGWFGMNQDNFNSSVSHISIDYQQNIWLTSDKQGVEKFSPNPFTDIFRKAGLKERVVNAVQEYEDDWYIACDDGLVVIGKSNYEVRDYSFIRQFENVRVRHIMKDSKGNLWFSTYGKDGLICLNPDREMTIYNERTAGTEGGRFRLTIELEDGAILAGGSTGLTWIRDGQVIAVLGEEDGLQSPQILDLKERDDGAILAASDGGGVYIIRNRKIEDCLNEEEGLSTLVVMRMVPCNYGYLFITSNAIYFCDPYDRIRRLEHFPYSNNYDVLITSDGKAWVSSSAGIFVTKEKELLADGDYSPILLNIQRGFDTTLTSNAWNTTDSEGNYYLCCSTGVKMISLKNYSKTYAEGTLRIGMLSADEEEVVPGDGRYAIPSTAGRIVISPILLDYSLSNPLLHMYLEGYDEEGITCNHSELTDYRITNLPYGTYLFHIEVLDEQEGDVLRELTVTLYKDSKFYERTPFRIYLVLMVGFVVILLTWILSKYSSLIVIRRQYDQIRDVRKEAKAAGVAQSRFLAELSREIQAPINEILSCNTSILEEESMEGVRNQAKRIRRIGGQLQEVVSEILDISRIRSGNLKMVQLDYELADVLIDCVLMVRYTAEEKGIELVIDADSGMPGQLYGDEIHVRQIVRKMLANVILYSVRGTVRMEICQRKAAETDSVFLCIAVSTSAVTQEQVIADPIIEPEGHKEQSMVRQLVDLLGGRIWFEKEGEESTVYAEIPQRVRSWEPMGDFGLLLKSRLEKENYEPGEESVSLIESEMGTEINSGLEESKEADIVNSGFGKSITERTARSGVAQAASGEEFGSGVAEVPSGEEFESGAAQAAVGEEFESGVAEVPSGEEFESGAAQAAVGEEFGSGVAEVPSGEEFESGAAQAAVGERFESGVAEVTAGEAVESGVIEETIQETVASEVGKTAVEETVGSKLGETTVQETAGQEIAVVTTGKEFESGVAGVAAGEAVETGVAGAAAGAGDEVVPESFEAILRAAGIDIEAGMQFCMREEGFYRQMLLEYIGTRRDEVLGPLFDKEDWENYRISVHALKSTSLTIGAKTLSDHAKELEFACRDGNIGIVKEKHAALMEEYRSVTSAILHATEMN